MGPRLAVHRDLLPSRVLRRQALDDIFAYGGSAGLFGEDLTRAHQYLLNVGLDGVLLDRGWGCPHPLGVLGLL